ncbi:MAG: VOC family protein [Planctomycetota bacterium]|jgi:uncharacterized glyoxalase superfamily protein PhnB
MAPAASPVPEGFTTVTPHLVVKGASDAIEFYKKAFNAEEICRMPGPDGNSVMHAEIKIGNAMLMIVDEMPMMERWVSPARLNGTTVGLCMYVEDADAAFKKAVDAGAEESMKPMDTFWGDRYSKVTDPYGHEWEICTHLEDLSPEEIGKRAQEWMSSMGECNL